MRHCKKAIEKFLQVNTVVLPFLYRPYDIRQIPDDAYVPPESMYPCIGIRSGNITYEYEEKPYGISETIRVRIWVYAKEMSNKDGRASEELLEQMMEVLENQLTQVTPVLEGYYVDNFPVEAQAQLIEMLPTERSDPELFVPINQEVEPEERIVLMRQGLEVAILRQRINVLLAAV